MDWTIYSYDLLPSTNQWAKEQINHLQKNSFSLIIADQQSQGRGQFGRKWHSPKNCNLYMSFCFFRNEELEPLRITHLLALATANFFKECQLDPKIKWPNDLLVDTKKIAGILCEVVTLNNSFAYVVGIGININMSQEEINSIDQPATSLFVETGKIWPRDQVMERIKTLFSKNLELFFEKGFEQFISELEAFQVRNHNKF